jgi:hypothetical protein
MKTVSFTLKDRNKYYGDIDGQQFFIGDRVSYKGNNGLRNLKGDGAPRYDRKHYREEFGFWADFIHPTAAAESNLFFHTLNTYDRAHFTFSFLQYAAHVPNGDFVMYLRALLNTPSAREYFPDLALLDGRISRITEGGAVQLESNTSTDLLMKYLNPTVKAVEDVEVINAAKFVHWAQNDPQNRQLQVAVGVSRFKRNMFEYAVRYNLDGAEDTVCLVIADIRHQGRAKSTAILDALKKSNPMEALLRLGGDDYAQRVTTLEKEIKALVSEGTLGKRKYSVSKSAFV